MRPNGLRVYCVAYLKWKKAGENRTVVLVLAIPSCLHFPVLPFFACLLSCKSFRKYLCLVILVPQSHLKSLDVLTHKKTLSSCRKYFFQNGEIVRFFMKIWSKKERARTGRRRSVSSCCLERWYFERENKINYMPYLCVLFIHQQINVWLLQVIQTRWWKLTTPSWPAK